MGVNLEASYCRRMSAGVAQRLRTLAPTSPADRSIILPVEPVFDCLRTAYQYEVARSRRSFGRRRVITS